jgi:hypothetical protein
VTLVVIKVKEQPAVQGTATLMHRSSSAQNAAPAPIGF